MKPILYSALALALAAGCKKNEEEKPADESAETEAAAETEGAAEKEAPPAGEVNLAAIDDVMKHYEDCRAKLAADQADVSECAGAVAKAAEAAAGDVPADHANEVAAKAKALAATPSDDIEKVRLAFGELSREVVEMLTAVPAAAKKYHVFECSMAKGYKLWAQAGATMANPYMGSKMLECGSEVSPHGEGGGEDHEGMDHGDMDMKKKEG